jgi:hypothetical protein
VVILRVHAFGVSGPKDLLLSFAQHQAAPQAPYPSAGNLSEIPNRKISPITQL